MDKRNKGFLIMLKKRYIFLFLLILILLFITKNFLFLRVKITDEYYIQQKLFTKNYVLKSKKKGSIVEHIYEWRNEDEYIYGSGYGYYFIYNKTENELLIYDEENQSEEFYTKIKELGYKYRMDNCTRIIDFTMIY